MRRIKGSFLLPIIILLITVFSLSEREYTHLFSYTSASPWYVGLVPALLLLSGFTLSVGLVLNNILLKRASLSILIFSLLILPFYYYLIIYGAQSTFGRTIKSYFRYLKAIGQRPYNIASLVISIALGTSLILSVLLKNKLNFIVRIVIPTIISIAGIIFFFNRFKTSYKIIHSITFIIKRYRFGISIFIQAIIMSVLLALEGNPVPLRKVKETQFGDGVSSSTYIRDKGEFKMGVLQGILGNANTASVSEVMSTWGSLFSSGEEVKAAYKLVRDYIIFTNKRLVCIDVQGITGKKVEVKSVPYSQITAFSVQTAGVLDLNAELFIWIASSPFSIQKTFNKNVNIYEVQSILADAITEFAK